MKLVEWLVEQAEQTATDSVHRLVGRLTCTSAACTNSTEETYRLITNSALLSTKCDVYIYGLLTYLLTYLNMYLLTAHVKMKKKKKDEKEEEQKQEPWA